MNHTQAITGGAAERYALGEMDEEERDGYEEHFFDCPECAEEVKTAAIFLENAKEVVGSESPQAQPRSLGAADEPRAGRRARVWGAIERERGRRRWTGVRVLVPVGLATAAALILALPLARGPAPLSLSVEIVAGRGAARRGIEAHPGDRLTLQARTGGARHVELRVYRNDSDLVLRCEDRPPCERRADRLKASLTLDSRGTYQAVVLASGTSLPEPVGGMGRDAGLALASGAAVELAQVVQVR